MFSLKTKLWLASIPLLFAGCELTTSGTPSVLVIAVDGLSFETVSCEAEHLEGLRAFCEESVRFSHAFTPSTLAQPALASVLTGLYPFDHGVRHNGDDFLSARFTTAAEVALARGYHTLFVSGGSPIWRKSGLAQGFEVFDDTMDIAPGLYYRPVSEVVRLATQWFRAQDDGRPTFVTLYLTDLQFPRLPTRTNEGELRALGFEPQLEEIDETLLGFVKWLKKERRWNNTHVVLLGLGSLDDGDPDESGARGEPATLNLHSHATQVTLMIKPARRERDEVKLWGVDRNVSLVDLGHTLFDWFGAEAPATSLPALKPQSLRTSLAQPEPYRDEGRLILSESAWGDWLEGAGLRWAVRQNHFLYIHDESPLIYNTLTDRLENLPLRVTDPLWLSLNGDIMALMRQAQTPPFRGMTSHWPEQLRAAHAVLGQGQAGVWREGPALRWYLHSALARGEWREVKRLSQEIGEPVGTYIAARHMGESLPMPRNPCVRLMLMEKGDKKQFQSECEDERVLALYAWVSAGKDDGRASAQERFLRLHAQNWMDQEIGRLNYLNGLRWDVDRELPEGPQIVDYLLTLKEFESHRRRVASYLESKTPRP